MARLVLHQNEIDALSSPAGIVGHFMLGFAEDVANRARATAPIDSGRLKANIATSGRFSAGGVVLRVGTDPQSPRGGYRYAVVAHQGRRRISKTYAMKFVGTKAPWVGHRVETTQVAGAKGQPFLTDAFRDVGLALPDVTWRETTFNTLTDGDVIFPFHESRESAETP